MLPAAFTEHGALMAAPVLNTPVAVKVSLQVVRAFVRTRQLVAANQALARRVANLEKRAALHVLEGEAGLRALSPVTLTSRLDEKDRRRLQDSTISVLREWTDRLREAAGDEFPEGVTAFREGFAVHGRFGKPCPDCGSAVQRIVHAENETSYCARCQCRGKLLADRALSKLLRHDWPRTIDE